MKNNELKVEYVDINKINPYSNNAKEHPDWQVDQIIESIEKFGNCDPIGVWTNENGELVVVEGHGRLMALNKMGADNVPVIYLDHLSDEQRRAYALVHNQLTMNTDWRFDELEDELNAITNIDMTDFGFDNHDNDSDNVKIVDVELKPYRRAHYLVSVDIDSNDKVLPIIDELMRVDGCEVIYGIN